MSPLRLPRALVAASVFLLVTFAYLNSTFSRVEEDLADFERGEIEVAIRPQTVQETLLLSYTPPPSAAPLPISSSSSAIEAVESVAASPEVLSPSDVVLFLKTGSSSVWRRLPLHLLTTFANDRIPNYAIYSDAAERVAPGVETVDVIANVSHLLEEVDVEAHRIYSIQKANLKPNIYQEQAGLPGDTTPAQSQSGNSEGWVLDRYKFLPMLAHARERWPDAAWYVYIEDDTYIFWENMLQWLSRQSYDEAVYLGASSGPSNATFAQGGSGIAFSQALMTKVFASTRSANLETYGQHTAHSCCGDIILGDVMRDYGIKVNRGEFGGLALRPEPPWKTRFDVAVWCEPVFTFHHLHQQDMAMLAELEGDLTKEKDRRVLFRDVYMKFIDPYLQIDQVSDWDNNADMYLLDPDAPLPAELQDSAADLDSATSTNEG